MIRDLIDGLEIIQAHDFDPLTMFCRRCGKSMRDAVEAGRKVCDATPNCIGISHILSARKLRELVGSIDQ